MTTPATITEADFRALCARYGTPDDIPIALLPENVAASLSMEDRFFDEPQDVDAAVTLLSSFFAKKD